MGDIRWGDMAMRSGCVDDSIDRCGEDSVMAVAAVVRTISGWIGTDAAVVRTLSSGGIRRISPGGYSRCL